ncbi:MAG: hypothetical protein KA170_01720 [Candidatus Promineofilum sp.]|nr:hypothetical protein [Promineifilum sp.]
MDELQRAVSGLGLSWAQVWVLRLDRRAGTLVVVAADGRKFTTTLAAELLPGTRPPIGRRRPAAVRRVKAIKSIHPQPAVSGPAGSQE